MVSARLKSGTQVSFCPSEEMIGEITAQTVFQAAKAGDSLAGEIVQISASYLGQGLAILIDILNPQCIVIGSIYTRNEAYLKPLVESILEKEAIPAAREVCRILPAALGEHIGDYAALCVAMQ